MVHSLFSFSGFPFLSFIFLTVYTNDLYLLNYIGTFQATFLMNLLVEFELNLCITLETSDAFFMNVLSNKGTAGPEITCLCSSGFSKNNWTQPEHWRRLTWRIMGFGIAGVWAEVLRRSEVWGLWACENWWQHQKALLSFLQESTNVDICPPALVGSNISSQFNKYLLIVHSFCQCSLLMALLLSNNVFISLYSWRSFCLDIEFCVGSYHLSAY